jgi:glucokinase
MGEKLAVGIDLGGTNITAALVAENGRIAHSVTRRTEAARGSKPVIDDMGSMVDELIANNKIRREDIVGLGIGSPGPLSHRDGIIYKAANLPGWINVKIREGLRDRTGLPTILDNDANAASFGEYWAGAGKDVRELVVLTLGTGIGSGVIINGEVLRGHFENAGELGHMIVVADGRQCSCGQHGCLEAYASPGNMAKYCVEQIKCGTQTTLKAVLEREGHLGSRAIAEQAQAGDEFARKCWDDACKYIAIAAVNVQHAFNSQMVVLAGGMTKAGDYLLSRVREHFHKQRWVLCDDHPEITISILGNEAGVVGAGGLAWASHSNGHFS